MSTQDLSESIRKQFAEFKEFRRALTQESDRGCALFAAAFLDTTLEQLIRAVLLDSKRVEEDLLQGTAPLATFSARIKFSYYLGLISAECRSELDIIRKIRNDFAHDASLISFDTPAIANRCRGLSYSYHESSHRARGHFTASTSKLLAIIQRLTAETKRATLRPDDRPTEAEKAAVREGVAAQFKELYPAADPEALRDDA